MATHCPKCQRRLSFTDWHQTCPECGTNLLFNGFEDRFFEDAKYAELGNAKVRVWWARVITCLFGGKLQIMRLCFILLPIAAALVPMCKLHIELPLFSRDISLGIIGAISAFSDNTIVTVLSLDGAATVTGDVVMALKSAVFVFAGIILCAVLIVVFEILCFLSAKKMSVILCALSAAGFIASVCGIFATNNLTQAAASFETMFSASAGFGHYLTGVAFIAVFVPNLILAIKGIEIKHREGDLYRVEVAKKLRRKEISIEELSQPIFETEEERLAREEAIENTMNGKSSEDAKKEDDEE